jgi:DNA-binding NtrC family response regulator
MTGPTDANGRDGVRAPEGAAGAVARRGRVLVVDDEPLVGLVIQRAFEDEHEVVVVSSAREALDLLETDQGFDVVLSDLMMPEMSGMALHGELARSHPDLARCTVLLTGGAYTLEARQFLETVQVEVLEKPFELDALRAIIARMVATRR